MPLQLLPASESDATRAVAIEKLAYADDPLGHILFPGPFPESGDSRVDVLINQLRTDSGCKWMKVVESDLEGQGQEEMVAFSQWYLWETPRPRGYHPAFQWGQGSNPEACELFFGTMMKKQDERFAGNPFVYLKLLHTDPKHQKRGAASMLLKWGVEQSERLQLPAYLEASDAGVALYEKFGFREVDKLVIDVSKWGGTTGTVVLMLREPEASK